MYHFRTTVWTECDYKPSPIPYTQTHTHTCTRENYKHDPYIKASARLLKLPVPRTGNFKIIRYQPSVSRYSQTLPKPNILIMCTFFSGTLNNRGHAPSPSPSLFTTPPTQDGLQNESRAVDDETYAWLSIVLVGLSVWNAEQDWLID